MNPTIKAEWIESLLSGNYAQGTGTLRRINNTFCCLGVLCDLAEKAGIVTAEAWPIQGRYGYADSDALPPAIVCEWAGIGIDQRYSMAKLAMANDHQHLSFAEIAKLIEETL